MLDKVYNPAQLEPKWADSWTRSDLFHCDETSPRPPFSIVIPPPNVTGSLHVGHALNNTLQDVLCRYMRMKGHEVLWMPGTDHAGIATQNVVERQLREQKLTKHDLGREKFIERVWKWKEQSGGQISSQLRRLGCSCDWQRERFTMDEGLSHAVREVFVRLFHEGLIYRGDYMINWCPRCESALADLEVEYPDEPESGVLYRLRYPLVDPPKGGPDAIIVDTTRPETMLGDTAVAVHPEDERYRTIVGHKVRLPVTDRIVPIIADSFVDPEFGSGAVKITPGHDPNDFEAGRRHQLPIITVIGSDGKMAANAGPYAGLDRFECRKKIVADFEATGVLLSKSPHLLKTGRCYRCHSVTEPLVSTQWFMRMKEMAENAARAVTDGATEIVPASWAGTYLQWLGSIRDWCISRQLWWGHQIPVWYCSCGEIIAQVTPPKHCPKCQSGALRQDEDVLDTWFSSALWPFSTMGWPEETPLLKRFYPTSVLVTGFDILFFWVARMMMMGLKLTKQVPFCHVYLHAMVRDEHGQKMSKTKGNVVDPLEIIDAYGADALRFTLTILSVQGRDVNLSLTRIEGYRNFINKIWNAVRFTGLSLGEGNESRELSVQSKADFGSDIFSRWIRSRLAHVISENEESYTSYDFSGLCAANYRFFWDEFCAWYLEFAKLKLKNATAAEQGEIKRTLVLCVDVSLRLLHPVIPFVTEELWGALPLWNGKTRGPLVRETFPTAREFSGAIVPDVEAESEVALLQETIVAVRTIRAEKGVPPERMVEVFIEGDPRECKLVLAHADVITGLARISSLSKIAERVAPAQSVTTVVSGIKVIVSLGGALDERAHRERLEKQLREVETELTRVRGKLENPSFIERAPKEVIEKEQGKLREFTDRAEVLRTSLKELG